MVAAGRHSVIGILEEDTPLEGILWIEGAPSTSKNVLNYDYENVINSHAGLFEPAAIRENDVAHLYYTSGTTGRPKGVAIAHRSAAALIAWAKTVFGPEDLRGVLASTSICFDLSIFEMFVPLSIGSRTILAENILRLVALPASEDVTLINTVPSAIAELLRTNSIPASVRTINLAGEPLKNNLVQQIYQLSNIHQVFDLYGPSEDTTYSTYALNHRKCPQHVLLNQ